MIEDKSADYYMGYAQGLERGYDLIEELSLQLCEQTSGLIELLTIMAAGGVAADDSEPQKAELYPLHGGEPEDHEEGDDTPTSPFIGS